MRRQPLERRGNPVPVGFRAELALSQPAVLVWLDKHLEGAAFRFACELAARYFEVAARWGEMPRQLTLSELEECLTQQTQSIAPAERWTSDLPLPIPRKERRLVGRLLSAMTLAGQSSAAS